jgi:hypothetical protein
MFLNTIGCGEQSGKTAMSPIRQRFVPALIVHRFAGAGFKAT